MYNTAAKLACVVSRHALPPSQIWYTIGEYGPYGPLCTGSWWVVVCVWLGRSLATCIYEFIEHHCTTLCLAWAAASANPLSRYSGIFHDCWPWLCKCRPLAETPVLGCVAVFEAHSPLPQQQQRCSTMIFGRITKEHPRNSLVKLTDGRRNMGISIVRGQILLR